MYNWPPSSTIVTCGNSMDNVLADLASMYHKSVLLIFIPYGHILTHQIHTQTRTQFFLKSHLILLLITLLEQAIPWRFPIFWHVILLRCYDYHSVTEESNTKEFPCVGWHGTCLASKLYGIFGFLHWFMMNSVFQFIYLFITSMVFLLRTNMKKIISPSCMVGLWLKRMQINVMQPTLSLPSYLGK